MGDNKYSEAKHDSFIECTRSRCGARNAPKESDDFLPSCWKCGADLPVEADVSVGEVVEVDVFDFHESGAGVGRMDSGLIVLIDDAMPEGRYRVEIETTSQNHATASKVEKLSDELSDDDSTGDDEESDTRYGRGENFWG